ncbi:hypothetical protein GCK32_010605, partial [Trichostrongylus colubriformis]
RIGVPARIPLDSLLCGCILVSPQRFP